MINILAKGAREENKAYFSHAISEAIREIRTINDAILESKQQYLERFYQMKVKSVVFQLSLLITLVTNDLDCVAGRVGKSDKAA